MLWVALYLEASQIGGVRHQQEFVRMNQSDLTLVLAIWGATLSTLAILVDLARFKRDRARINVKVQGGYLVHPPNARYTASSYILIVVTNSGQRPLTIVTAGLRPPRGHRAQWLLTADAYQRGKRELSEGQTTEFIMEESGIEFSSNKYVACVVDAAGRKYWSHSVFSRVAKLHRLR